MPGVEAVLKSVTGDKSPKLPDTAYLRGRLLKLTGH